MDTTLLILAAGMGSRYGGLKQMDGFGPNGETIMDYSIYDAINAGFTKVVFVIRGYFKEDFEAFLRKKLEGRIKMEFVTQELYDIPSGSRYIAYREKPWGTAHAVLRGKDVINGPFAVINADDYYGVEAYSTLVKFFKTNKTKDTYAVVAYQLKNTLSDHGTVNRGICKSDKRGNLTEVVETLKISKNKDGSGSYETSSGRETLPANSLVSMNMFGFLPSYFTKTEKQFKTFLKKHGLEMKSEFFIPFTLDNMINNKTAKVKVLTSPSKWFGVTYKEDKPKVVKAIKKLIKDGVYPKKLWS